jgi:hypothetical protein
MPVPTILTPRFAALDRGSFSPLLSGKIEPAMDLKFSREKWGQAVEKYFAYEQIKLFDCDTLPIR